MGRGEVSKGLQEEDLEHVADVLQGSLAAVPKVGRKQIYWEAITREIWKAEIGVAAVEMVM